MTVKPRNYIPGYPFRRRLVLFVLLIGFGLLAARAYELQVLRSDFLNLQGTVRQQRVVEVPAHRGAISDRNGEPLAISTPVDSVWMDPGAFADQGEAVATLARRLDLKPAELRRKLTDNRDREFMYIKRQVPPSQAQSVVELDLEGVFLQREYRRYYPTTEVSAHVLGFTDIDDRGQEGIELAYDDWLAGHPGKKRVVRDRLGRVVDDIARIETARPGRDLTLSLDKRLQYLAYRELKSAVQQHDAVSGSVVLMDSYSGEVLAMVNQPAFNPHNRDTFSGERYRNRAVTDVFEPGSTMKPFTVAAALDYDYFRPASRLNTSPGYIKVGGHRIRDARDYGVLGVEGVIQHSSNVGATKIALSMPTSELWHTYNRFGFGRGTGSGFPGESLGSLKHFDQWSELEQATMAFGYGLSTTPLQLAHAYSVLANDGYDVPVTFVRQDEPPAAKRVLSADTAGTLRTMLSSVVAEGGTGFRARVPGYRIAGKTGTVRKLTENGYSDEAHMAVFAGMAPLSRPRLVMVVVINRPQGERYSGGQVAAPVFATVMSDALRLLNIPPDAPSTLYAERNPPPEDRT